MNTCAAYIPTNNYRTNSGLCESSDFLENGLGPDQYQFQPNLSARDIHFVHNKFPCNFIPDQRTTSHKQNTKCNAQEPSHFGGVRHDWSWNFYNKTWNSFRQPWSYGYHVPDNGRQPGPCTVPDNGRQPGPCTVPDNGRQPGPCTVPDNGRQPRPCTVPTAYHRPSFNAAHLHSSSAAISDTLYSRISRISKHDCPQNETYPPNPKYLPMLSKADSPNSENLVVSDYLTAKTLTADNVKYHDSENTYVSPLNETYLQYIKEFKNDLSFLSQVPNKMSTPYTSPSEENIPNKITSPFNEGQHNGDAFPDNSVKCGIKQGRVVRHQQDSFPVETPKRPIKRVFQSEVEEAVYYLITKYMKYD